MNSIEVLSNFFRDKEKRKVVVEYAKGIVVAVIVALLFRSFLFEAYKIPSGSMTPTLMIGDYLFISKYSYGYSKHSFPFTLRVLKGRIGARQPVRGDVIVFKSPNEQDSKYYIKRLIGLPGDRVQVKNTVLYINDIPVLRKKIGIYTAKYEDEPQGVHNCYEETLPNGVSYSVLDTRDKLNKTTLDQTAVYTVPAGSYFMMGDHRDHSVDSRYIPEMGFIPEENLVGRAEVLFWTRDFSFWGLLTKFQWGRLFTRLRYEHTLSIS